MTPKSALIVFLMVLLLALAGHASFHAHAPGDPSGATCWRCVAGPVLLLPVVLVVLVVPAAKPLPLLTLPAPVSHVAHFSAHKRGPPLSPGF